MASMTSSLRVAGGGEEPFAKLLNRELSRRALMSTWAASSVLMVGGSWATEMSMTEAELSDSVSGRYPDKLVILLIFDRKLISSLPRLTWYLAACSSSPHSWVLLGALDPSVT